MEWSIFALLQMFIITIAVSLACWLRMRGLQTQNEALRLRIEETPPAPAISEQPSQSEWVQQQIDALDQTHPSSTIVSVALTNLLAPADDFEQTLVDCIRASSILGDDSSTQDLEAELEELRNKLAAASDNAGETGEDRTEELKALLQQFTKDSREMMACIQTLEKENAQLREQLGLDAETGVADPASTGDDGAKIDTPQASDVTESTVQGAAAEDAA